MLRAKLRFAKDIEEDVETLKNASRGDVGARQVQEILSYGLIEVNEVYMGLLNWTLVGIAADKGQDEVLRVLLDAGADPNVGHMSGGEWTPLHYAASNCHPKVAKVLLEGGAEVDKTDGEGSTPLHLAAQNQNEEWKEKDLVLRSMTFDFFP